MKYDPEMPIRSPSDPNGQKDEPGGQPAGVVLDFSGCDSLRLTVMPNALVALHANDSEAFPPYLSTSETTD
jgi:hypothetical protein